MFDKTPVQEEKTKSANNIISSSTTKLAACTEDEAPYEPRKNRNLTHPLGTMGALFHMMKGSLGSGILAMPVAFKNGGLWTSLACAILVGIIYTHCVHILVYSSQVLCVRLKKPRLEFAQIAEGAFQTGPRKWRSYSVFVREVVDWGLFLSYYACCIVYVVFTASTLKQVMEQDFDVSLDVRLYILFVTLLVLPIGIIRSLKYLMPFSFLAVWALMIGCLFVLYELFQDMPPISSRPAFTSFSRLPLLFSTVIFSLDGIGTVLPIENTMENPQHFLGCPGVLNVSMVWLLVVYCVMGFFGYLRYGDDTQGSITLNINSSFMGQTVKMLTTVNFLCSYGLFFYVPCEILWRKLEPRVDKSKRTFYYYVMRLGLIFGSVILAAIVPDLESFVGLVGAVCSSTLDLFVPPVIELFTFWEDQRYMGRYRWKVYKNLVLIIVWLVTFITGTHVSMLDILALYR